MIARLDALKNDVVAVSVSDSPSLGQMGLAPPHLVLAIRDLARFCFIMGASISYAGDLRPDGFTYELLSEAERYTKARQHLHIFLARPTHTHKMGEIEILRRTLGVHGRAILLDEVVSDDVTQPDAFYYSRAREQQTAQATARVLVGGQTSGYAGRYPGIVEEAILAIKARIPLYISGGFGGASLGVAMALGITDSAWLGSEACKSASLSSDSVAALLAARDEFGLANTALTKDESDELSSTYSSSAIPVLVTTGLTRLRSLAK